MEHWLLKGWDWTYQNREWLFSGVGVLILGGAAAWFRDRKYNKAEIASENSQDGKPGIKPLLVHTTDDYLVQVGVLFSWRVKDPFKFLQSLGDEANAARVIEEQLRYCLTALLEAKSLGEIRDERKALSKAAYDQIISETGNLGIEFERLRIGRITPVDRHA